MAHCGPGRLTGPEKKKKAQNGNVEEKPPKGDKSFLRVREEKRRE
jgi:hypothetical protein